MSLISRAPQVSFVNADGAEVLDPRPPFRITLPKTLKGNANALSGNKISEINPADNADMVDVSPKEKLIVEAYTPPDPGPYPQDQPKQNSVKFTPTQVLLFSTSSEQYTHFIRTIWLLYCAAYAHKLLLFVKLL